MRTIQPVRKPPLLHFPLRRLALCLDCDSCFEIGPGSCPACGSETLAPLARFFQANGSSAPNGKLRKQLLVVARENPHIYEYLKRMFAGNETLEVVMDRRKGDRRGHGMARLPERRRTNSSDRRRQEIDHQLRALGWAIVLLDVARDQERPRPRSLR